jgi:hypothetical protein
VVAFTLDGSVAEEVRTAWVGLIDDYITRE